LVLDENIQLLLEIMKKEELGLLLPGNSTSAQKTSRSSAEDSKKYRQRYGKLFNSFSAAKMERAGFLHFCGTHGLTLQGRLFLMVFWAKGLVRCCLRQSARSKSVSRNNYD
jgi:hypothetical protein